MIKVFFDSSVILSSIISNKVFSFKLLELVKKRKIIGVISETVIEEVKRNLEKIKIEKKQDLGDFFVSNNFIILEKISEEDIKPYLKTVEEKDAHIFFAAILAKCEFLATLDKKHFASQIKIGSPHEIYNQIS